jgi:hypothetical protein
MDSIPIYQYIIIMTKRILRYLLLLIIPIAVLFILYEDTRNKVYAIPCALTYSFIVFVNFPAIVNFMHSRPTYYEDLLDEEDEVDKRRFQKVFNVILSILSAVFFALMVLYFFYQVNSTTLRGIELVGVLRGLGSIYGDVHQRLGSYVIEILEKCKSQKRNNSSTLPPTIQMQNVVEDIV